MEETNSTPEQTIPKRKALGKVEPVLTPLEQKIISLHPQHNIANIAARLMIYESDVRAALAKVNK